MYDGFFPTVATAPSRRDMLTLVPLCGACKLNTKCRSPLMPLDGRGKKRVMVIGEAPGAEEDLEGRPFVGASGKFLMECLEGTGLDLRRDCWIINSLSCRPENSVIDNERKIDFCRPRVIKFIREKKPEVVILLGGTAVKSVLGWLWKEDVGNVTRWAGWQIPSQEINAWVVPTFHPSHVLRQLKERPNERVLQAYFQRHLYEAAQLTGRPWEEVPDYKSRVEILLSPEQAARRIRQVYQNAQEVAFDYETTTLKPDGPHASIFACAVSSGKETVAYPWLKETAQATAEMLSSRVPKLGWNLKFEDRWTRRKMGFWVQNCVYDGMQGAHVLDNRKGITSLKFQAFVNLGLGAYDAGIKPFLKSKGGTNSPNRIREAPLKDLLLYCGLDSFLEYKLCKMQMKSLGM